MKFKTLCGIVLVGGFLTAVSLFESGCATVQPSVKPLEEKVSNTQITRNKGNKVYMESYNAEGKCEGSFKAYEVHEGNPQFLQLIEEGNFKDGKKEGIWKYYSSKWKNYSSIFQWKNYNIFMPDAEGSWNNSSKLKVEGNYKNGEKDGIFKVYDSDELLIEASYKDGKREQILNSKNGKNIEPECIFIWEGQIKPEWVTVIRGYSDWKEWDAFEAFMLSMEGHLQLDFKRTVLHKYIIKDILSKRNN